MLRRFCKELGRETGPFFLQNRLLSDVSPRGACLVFADAESTKIESIPLQIRPICAAPVTANLAESSFSTQFSWCRRSLCFRLTFHLCLLSCELASKQTFPIVES